MKNTKRSRKDIRLCNFCIGFNSVAVAIVLVVLSINIARGAYYNIPQNVFAIAIAVGFILFAMKWKTELRHED